MLLQEEDTVKEQGVSGEAEAVSVVLDQGQGLETGSGKAEPTEAAGEFI
jgi:hypothetical protein